MKSHAKSIFKNPIYLSHGVRSVIGKFGGSLKAISATELATHTLKAAIAKSENTPVDFVFLGHARQAGAGPNPARQTLIAAGLSETLPAMTLNQACASGMSAIFAACEKIDLGKATSIWAGGVESMSNTPYLLMNARWGARMGNFDAVDGMTKDGFFCPMSQMLMGETVERNLVPEFKISREEQDAYSAHSSEKAESAWKTELYKNETCEVVIAEKKIDLKTDEHRRDGVTAAGLSKLPPVFDKKTGTITAGNASGVTDGAAFIHVGLEKSKGTLTEVLDYETIALDPKRMGIGPVAAIQNLLKRQNLALTDIDFFEINEAFAAQVIACQRTLKIDESRLNVKGGSIAIGHPIGSTGARLSVSLSHTLKAAGTQKLGIASLCVSGGMGVAILLRSV